MHLGGNHRWVPLNMQITITIIATYLGQTKSRQPLYVSSGLFSMFYSKQTPFLPLEFLLKLHLFWFALKCWASPFSSKNALPSSSRQSTWGQDNFRLIYARWKGLFKFSKFEISAPSAHQFVRHLTGFRLPPFSLPIIPCIRPRVTRRRLGTSQHLEQRTQSPSTKTRQRNPVLSI